MPCQLCGGSDHPKDPHPLIHCPTFARVPQPVKDTIAALWAARPAAGLRDGPLAQWIYEHYYSPGAAQQTGGWSFYFSPVYRTEAEIRLTEERVYMSVRSQRIDALWRVLEPVFAANQHDIVQAKRCPSAAADGRPDGVVVYLRNKAAVWRFCDELRRLRRAGRITDADFNATTPPGTGRLPDLRGVATARQPESGESYGQELCRVLGSVFQRRNRPMQLPVMLDFMRFCLAELKANGIDIAQPWNRPRQAFGVRHPPSPTAEVP